MNWWGVLLLSFVVSGATVGAVGATNVVSIDGDSAPAVSEVLNGTDPLSIDTDGDGLEDGAEGETDPLTADTDADGVDDGVERNLGTDPTILDTDGDGLSDGVEVERQTKPSDPDSDDDGLHDDAEVAAGTDPLESDTDSDGLGDEREVRSEKLDPALADTDGDTLGDRTELDGPTEVDDFDTDNDELKDGQEMRIGSDPLEWDTDGDNLRDGAEVNREHTDGTRLPDADPTEMDLYVLVYVDNESSGLSSYDDVERDWADMPVTNPDGSTGIDLHLVDTRSLDRRLPHDGTQERFQELWVEANGIAGVARDPYHVVMFVAFDTDSSVGMGKAGGYFAALDGDRSDLEQRRTLNHELLHNVVDEIEADGRCDDDPYHYCEGGWLRAHGPEQHYLPEPIAEQIERNGFED